MQNVVIAGECARFMMRPKGPVISSGDVPQGYDAGVTCAKSRNGIWGIDENVISFQAFADCFKRFIMFTPLQK